MNQVKPSRFCKTIELIGNQDRVGAESGQSRGRLGADSGQSYSQSHGRGMARVADRVGTKRLSLIFSRVLRRNVGERIKSVGKTLSR
jgi:hypothetical protein